MKRVSNAALQAPSGIRLFKGRPREFDLQKALDAAMVVFWKKGYQGTSLPDLTEAMAINRPSLYAAFGNKQSLFRKVVERYLQSVGCFAAEALAEPKVSDAVRKLLTVPLTNPKSSRPPGCLLVNAALVCGEESDSIRRELAERRGQTELAIRARLEQAVAEGELQPSTNVAALAKFIATFNNGLAVQRTSGASHDELLAAAELAVRIVDAALTKAADR